MCPYRQAIVERHTKETQIQLVVHLDPDADFETVIDTPLPFFSHMLTALAVHGSLGLQLKAQGDIDVDPHHLIEDVGIVLGQALAKALLHPSGGAFSGISRAGCFRFAMDGTLADVALDLCGRGNLVWHVPPFESATVGTLDPRLFREFFKGVMDGLALAIHVNVPYRDNDHHVVEAIFKAFARSLRQAVTPLSFTGGDTAPRIMSTKGSIEAPRSPH
jgi:imidazoleglycerol-phosphate dehydratase